MNVFISWTRADEDVKNVLAKKLQEADISYWESDADCVSDFAAECTAAIKRCSVFVAIISEASMSRGYVKNEIITARDLEDAGALNLLVYKITDKPYTDRFNTLLNHISYETGNLINRTEAQRGTSSIDLLVNRIKKLLKLRAEGTPEKPFDVSMPKIDGLKLTKPGYFVDGSRDDVLQAIEQGLSRSNVLILEEFFGFGKRSVVKRFIECQHDKYTDAIMVRNEYGSLRDFFAAGLHFLNINDNAFADLQAEALLQAKFRHLEKLNEKTLLVITDVDLDGYADTALCELLAGLKCHVFLLTQEAAAEYGDWFPVIPVGRMHNEHLRDLFFHHYTRAYEEEQAALEEPLTRFFDNIGGHTKTVELTAAALNRDLGVSPEDLPAYLSPQSDEGAHLKDRVLQQIGNVFSTERLGGEELAALLVAAYLAVPYISEKSYRTVLETCGVTDWRVVTTLDEMRWLDVDVHNRTVSMEPIVAQIVFSKLPNAFPIMQHCLDFLMNQQYTANATIVLLESSKVRLWSRLEYFLTVIGLPECAAIFAQQRLYALEDTAYDTQKMAEAIRAFEEKYPASIGADIFAADAEDFEEQDAENIHTKSSVEASAVAIVRGSLPFSKCIAKNMDKLFFDFSASSSSILKSQMQGTADGIFNIEDIIGISQEDFTTLLEYCRSEIQSLSDSDEDSVSMSVWVECIAVLDAFFHRDFTNVQIGFYNLLEHLSYMSADFFDKSAFDMIIGVFQWICSTYASANIYSPVITLCEKLLKCAMPTRNHVVVLNSYITALRNSNIYTPALYTAYEEMLGYYEKSTTEIFELREDMLQAKKLLLLSFAIDLAKGERTAEALQQFAAARKLTISTLLDQELRSADTIVQTLVNTGEFQQAVAFIDRYFPSETRETFALQADEQLQKIVEEFAAYQSMAQISADDFAEPADPKKHMDYYQEFSRRNNSLLEQKYLKIADDALDFDFSQLTTEEITAHAARLRERAKTEKMLRLAPEAFALASEAGFRVLGYRHHFVQYTGAAAMADGKILEMLNGEGKTYTIVLTAFLHSLYGKRVYVVDQSEYLTGRNHQWMRGVYDLLGVSNAHVANTQAITNLSENVIYTSVATLVCGFLRYETDLTRHRADFRAETIIIDEADTTLVDESPKPCVIVKTEAANHVLKQAIRIWNFVSTLPYDETLYTIYNGQVILQPAMSALIEDYFNVSYQNLGQIELLRKLEQSIASAIWCHVFAEKDKDYFISKGEPVQEDKSTGMFRSFQAETQYFLCRENHLDTQQAERELARRSIALNRITLRDFFKRFDCVCGTTATAVSFREEFREIYNLDCFCVPPHLPVVRVTKYPALYLNTQAKEQAIIALVQEKIETKQPILIITQSTEESERYSKLLRRQGIAHNLLNAKNADVLSDMIANAGVPGSVLVTNALAGRGADIKLGGNPELKTRHELVELGEDIAALDAFVYCLPTDEQKASALYQKYHSILTKNKALCAADRQTVIEAGGLCVIGTSFFGEPRTEQQTIGRCGRQGEVGESWMFRSIDDEYIKLFFPASMRNWLSETFAQGDDIQGIPMFPQLKEAIHRAQKKLHKNMFATIRRTNDLDRHIDAAREAFIGKRFDMTDGRLTIEDIFREWATDKTVLQQVQTLQKGERLKEYSVVSDLFRNYPQLQTARGKKVSAVLCEIIPLELAKNLPSVNLEDPQYVQDIIRCLAGALLSGWEKFIEHVCNTSGQNTSEQTLAQFLNGEKQKLLRKPVEVLLHLKMVK